MRILLSMTVGLAMLSSAFSAQAWDVWGAKANVDEIGKRSLAATAERDPSSSRERSKWVLDYFFKTGRMPGDLRAARGEGPPPVGDADGDPIETSAKELVRDAAAVTAGLVHRGQSGALHESFSNVLSVAVRHWRQGVAVDEADWEALSNPEAFGHPAHVKDFVVTERDHGGVHANASIPDRAFYGAAIRIGGYVWEKSAKIWYVTLRDYLGPHANFRDCARLTTHVAGKLYGEGSREQQAVMAGWADVGILVKPHDALPRERRAP